MKHSRGILLLALVFGLVGSTTTRAGVIAELGVPEIDDLQVVAFELERRTRVDVEAVGILDNDVPRGLRWLASVAHHDDDEPEMSVSAWLLDAETREPVWRMRANDSYSIRDDLRGVDAELELDAGRYELYLASNHAWAGRTEFIDDDRDDRAWWQRLLPDGRRRLDDLKDDLNDCHVKLSAPGLDGRSVRTYEPTGEREGALLVLNRLGNSQLEVRGIAVAVPTRVGVYGVFEHGRDDRGPSDFSWIVEESTRELIWQAGEARTRAGGGSRKNRVVDDEIQLQSGRYLLYAGTDDSHSLEAFNAAPPHDPLNWGVTLLATNATKPGALSFFDPVPPGQALIDFSEAGDDQFREQPFRVLSDGALHVRASGEYIERDEHFADGAWIVNATSGDEVWRMTGANSMPAGGAEKNRMFDGLVELPRGDYVLYWVSDDSHSYEDWNSATPFEPAAWGVTLRRAGIARSAEIQLIDSRELAKDSGVLVAIVRAGDDARRRERFTLDQSTRVTVKAMGEGSGGSMYDFGTIRDGRGQVVWEMDYRQTEHAGGADKNRVVVDELTLSAGEYTVEYESDGSHSFEGWNATPPRDPLGWGITVRRAS